MRTNETHRALRMSTPAGRASSSERSKLASCERAIECVGLTHVSTDRRPASTIWGASDRSEAPNRKQRRHPLSPVLFPIPTHIFEEEIANATWVKPFSDSGGQRCPHSFFVLFVGAWPRQLNRSQRYRPRLSACAINSFRLTACIATRSNWSFRASRARRFDRRVLLQHMQRPGAVFPGAPRDERFLSCHFVNASDEALQPSSH